MLNKNPSKVRRATVMPITSPIIEKENKPLPLRKEIYRGHAVYFLCSIPKFYENRAFQKIFSTLANIVYQVKEIHIQVEKGVYQVHFYCCNNVHLVSNVRMN